MTHPEGQEGRSEARNATRFAWSNGLQNIGDQLVAAKTVLPWIFQAAGVPGFFTGLLVPIREAGSMLPQAALSPWVTTHRSRKKLWILGSIGQAASALIIALAALCFTGIGLGVVVIAALSALSIFRALCSIAGKDVQGRTISKGRRGKVTGRATQIGGATTLAVGLALYFLGDLPGWGLAALLGLGSLGWLAAALIFAGIYEPHSDEEPREMDRSWWKDTWHLFHDYKDFRSFVFVRSLLLVSALSTSFIVMLAQEAGSDALSGLAGFIVASGLASLVGGRVSGLLADKSSRSVMAGGAASASVILVLVVAAAAWLPPSLLAWIMPAAFFLVNLAHTAIRVARKTYVVDMAEGDQRTRFVGAANTLMGVFLLVAGGISALVALAGTSFALLLLAAMGFVGVWRARGLKEVSA